MTLWTITHRGQLLGEGLSLTAALALIKPGATGYKMSGRRVARTT